jgi:sugar phosphate isomerase/epimerase
MQNHKMTRRETLCVGAGAALALAGAALPSAAATAEPVIGVSTLGFPMYTNQALAKEFADNGINTTQLFLSQKDSNYWRYNGRNDLSDMTTARCEDIAATYRSAGIEIHSLGVYTNLIHPDAEERKANLAYFDEMMRIGDAMNVHVFITEAGHHHLDTPLPHHFHEAVWAQMVGTGKKLAVMAESHGATVLMEPYFGSFFATAKRTRLFLEDVDSPRIRALLDPANLLELNDLEEMFQQLAPWIDCLHAKDRKLHVERGVGAGKGDIDYSAFVRLAAKYTPHAPFILEYVGPDDYKEAVALLKKALS